MDFGVKIKDKVTALQSPDAQMGFESPNIKVKIYDCTRIEN
jgi:hypothetical protein